MFLCILFNKVKILSNFFQFSYISWPIIEDRVINVYCHLLSIDLFHIFWLLLDYLFLFYDWLLLDIVINFFRWNWFYFFWWSRLYFFRRFGLFWFLHEWKKYRRSGFRLLNFCRFFCINRWFFLYGSRCRTILFSSSSNRFHAAKQKIIDIFFEVSFAAIGFKVCNQMNYYSLSQIKMVFWDHYHHHPQVWDLFL